MQKRIVLSEGKNDVHLVSSFFLECDGSYAVKRFHGEDVQTKFRNVESRAIKNFREPRDEHHVLVKSENNKNNLTRAFSSLIGLLFSSHRYVAVTVVVDLDGGKLAKFFDDLGERVRDRQDARGITLGTYNRGVRNRDLVTAHCPVLTRQEREMGVFDVIAFRQTLERLTDIDKENDERDVKNEKIERLLEEDHVVDLLDSVLNDD